MLKKLICFLLIGYYFPTLYAQTVWYHPQEQKDMPISGRGWGNETGKTYHRFPIRFRKAVREELWNLSENSSGLYIDFTTDATDIAVKYTVTCPKSLNNVGTMATSGIDLYRRNAQGEWNFCSCFGSFNFGSNVSDTISYHYQNMIGEKDSAATFRLYLPLYNTVSSLQIGIPANKHLTFTPINSSNPIVVYGTSIAQGASASRPGMSWSNILQRKLDIPVFNLGFSGNGRLEPEVFRIMGELTNARLFIIDCIPNMDSPERVDSIYPRIIAGVHYLRSKTLAPILLTEHCGYNNSLTQKGLREQVLKANSLLNKAYMELKRQGIKNLEYLTANEIGIINDNDSQIDGVHATDIGMRLYANAYINKIRLMQRNKAK